jgi:hypothetical protein
MYCATPRHVRLSTSENWTLGVFNESVLIKRSKKKQNKQENTGKKKEAQDNLQQNHSP